jgi:hypothetical protein
MLEGRDDSMARPSKNAQKATSRDCHLSNTFPVVCTVPRVCCEWPTAGRRIVHLISTVTRCIGASSSMKSVATIPSKVPFIQSNVTQVETDSIFRIVSMFPAEEHGQGARPIA